MTDQIDFDRRLAAFFDDGPTRSPERPIEDALSHARAHPRRPDPLRVLRRDPMGSSWRAGTGVSRAMPLAAAVGLLVVAALAAASVGGWFDRDPGIIVPSPTTPSASPSPATPATVRIDLVESGGADAAIEITDASGTLRDAVSGQPGDGASVASGTVAVTAVEGEPDSVALTWSLLVCTSLHQLEIAEDGRTMTLSAPSCEGDAMARDLVLVLTFDGPVAPDAFAVTLEVVE